MSKAWTKDIYLDPHTFGNTRACEVLANMMNENVIVPYEKHRVLAFINMAICQFNGVSTIENDKVRNTVLPLVLRDMISRIDEMAYPPKFCSFLKNVMTHYYRRAMEGVV